MFKDAFKQVIEIINQIKEDKSVPKNVITKLDEMIEILNDDQEDVYIRIDKVIEDLEEISEDNNLQPYIRTQIWNITSLLESI